MMSSQARAVAAEKAYYSMSNAYESNLVPARTKLDGLAENDVGDGLRRKKVKFIVPFKTSIV
jgi:hypothetical protein